MRLGAGGDGGSYSDTAKILAQNETIYHKSVCRSCLSFPWISCCDSFRRQTIMFKLYFNSSLDSFIKAHNIGTGGVGSKARKRICLPNQHGSAGTKWINHLFEYSLVPQRSPGSLCFSSFKIKSVFSFFYAHTSTSKFSLMSSSQCLHTIRFPALAQFG